MRYRSSFEVSVDPTVAFDYLADGANSLPFHPAGTTVVREPQDEIALDTRFVFERPGGPGFSSTISRFERPERLEFTSSFDGRAPTSASWILVAVGSCTRLTVDTESSFLGPSWMKPLVGVLTDGSVAVAPMEDVAVQGTDV